jgi:putative spermidine/putrescine transport system permease protein
VPWLLIGLGVLYFFVPLIATAQFSLQGSHGVSLAAFAAVARDAGFWQSLRLSVLAALASAALGLAIIVPAAFWAHLKAPLMRPWVEILSVLPFVVPPIVLVFGIVRLYGGGTGLLASPTVMLLAAYAVIALPYLFRSIDNGLRSMDVARLTEAAQSLGAGWGRVLWRVILPNLRGSILGGTFLAFALIMGEYAIGSMLGFDTFGVYMQLTGENAAQQAAALALMAFALVWLLIGLLQLLGRGDLTTSSGAR